MLLFLFVTIHQNTDLCYFFAGHEAYQEDPFNAHGPATNATSSSEPHGSDYGDSRSWGGDDDDPTTCVVGQTSQLKFMADEIEGYKNYTVPKTSGKVRVIRHSDPASSPNKPDFSVKSNA
jgi:hypothetical protein